MPFSYTYTLIFHIHTQKHVRARKYRHTHANIHTGTRIGAQLLGLVVEDESEAAAMVHLYVYV